MNERPDTAGVAFPPPLLFATALGAGLLLGRRRAPSRWPAVLGVAAIAGGVLFGGGALTAIKATGSTPDPYAPTTALATTGVFRITRNPAYVGATSIYIGVALLTRSFPAMTLLPVVLALLDRGVVDREEQYLERTFGEDYRRYRAAVPRWF